jgi:hypothetical protein
LQQRLLRHRESDNERPIEDHDQHNRCNDANRESAHGEGRRETVIAVNHRDCEQRVCSLERTRRFENAERLWHW